MNTKAFNNLMVWRLHEPIALDDVALNAALAEHAARPPSASEMERVGFIEPLGCQDLYVERISPETSLIAINIAKRMLPGKIVRRIVDNKAKELAETTGRKVYASEKQRIKEQVFEELLPRAFVDHSQVYAMLQGPYIILGVASAKRGEMLLDILRHAVGSLKVTPVSVPRTPIHHYTRWFGYGDVRDSARFTLGSQFTAHGTTSDSEAVKGSWPFSSDETLSDWVVQGGKKVTAIGLHWQSETLEGEVPFVVNEMLGVKGIKWPPELVDRAVNEAGDEAEAVEVARATLLLLSHEIGAMWRDLLNALGGEALPQHAQATVTIDEGDDDDGLI